MTATAQAGNGDRERMKNVMDWAISSQAPLREGEGSTTNAYSLRKFGIYGIMPAFHRSEGDEATRVRGHQKLFEMQDGATGNFVSEGWESVQGLRPRVSERMAQSQCGKETSPAGTGVRKGRGKNPRLHEILRTSQPREGEVGISQMAIRESGAPTQYEAGEVSEGRGIPRQSEISKQRKTQEAQAEYAGLGNTRFASDNIRNGDSPYFGNWRNASRRPHHSASREVGKWSDGSREPSCHYGVGKLQKEQRYGGRYSLDLARKAKMYGINNRAITHRQKIWDISKIPLPLQDRIGNDAAKNSYKE